MIARVEQNTSTLVPDFGSRWDVGNEIADNVLSALAILLITWTLHSIIETMAFRLRGQVSIDGLMTFFLLRSQGHPGWFRMASHPLYYAKKSVLNHGHVYSEHRVARWRVFKSVLIRLALISIEFAAIILALETTKDISVSGKGIRIMGDGLPVHFRGQTFGCVNAQRVPPAAESEYRLAYCLIEDPPTSVQFSPIPRVKYTFTYHYRSGQIDITLSYDGMSKSAFLTYFFENSTRSRVAIPILGYNLSSPTLESGKQLETALTKAIERSFMKHVKLYHMANGTKFVEGLGRASGLIGSRTQMAYGPVVSNVTKDWMTKELFALANKTYVSQMLGNGDDLIEGTGSTILNRIVLFRFRRPILSTGGLFLMLGALAILQQICTYFWPLDHLEFCFTALKEVLQLCCISGPADRALTGHISLRWSAEPPMSHEDIRDYRRGHMGLIVPHGFVEGNFDPTVLYS